MTSENKRFWHLAFALGLLATILAVRVALVWRSPDFKFPDEHTYLDIASHIATGNRFAVSPGSPVFAVRQAPGLPLLLGCLGKVIPLTPLTAKMTNAFVSAITAALYALIAWQLTRRLAPALGMLTLVGFHPPLLYTGVTNYPQTFQGLWMALLALVWAWRCTKASPSPGGGALDGSLIAIGALFVPTQIFVAPAALAFHWRRGRAWLLRYAAWAAAAGTLVLTPWTLRNLATEHAFIPFSTNAGEQLYLGFNPQAGMNTGIQIALPDELQAAVQNASSGKKAETVFRQAAIKWMSENPAATIRLWTLKALNFFRWDNGKMVTETERSAAREWIARLTSLGVFGIALLGVWRGRGRGSPWPSTATILMLALAAGHACFISRYRYRLPFEPFLLLVGIAGTFAAGEKTHYATGNNP